MSGRARGIRRAVLVLLAIACYLGGLATPYVSEGLTLTLLEVVGATSFDRAATATLALVIGVPIVLLALVSPVLVPAGYRFSLFAVCAGAVTLLGVSAFVVIGAVPPAARLNFALTAMGGAVLLIVGGAAIESEDASEHPGQ